MPPNQKTPTINPSFEPMLMTTSSPQTVDVDIQIATADDNIPSDEDFRRWVTHSLPKPTQNAELTLRIVGTNESQALNLQFRQKDKPTNVLSFPADLPEGIDIPLLGDIVICAHIVEKEAKEQHKTLEAHWAHMVVHGVLHLIGYDHIEDEEAHEMETLETRILTELGFPPPYEDRVSFEIAGESEKND